ncbi:hypothetical protein QBC39DRAFT_409418 [Podospora conica]|nr:hypothetical protein QBC39DRAFT_409418 [Schizothecium conicum]
MSTENLEAPPMRRHPDSANDLTSEFFGLKRLSDCQVKCGDRTWDLHKVIICRRSKFFDKALNGGFQEAQTNVVTFSENSPKHVDWALRCLYSGDMSHIQDVLSVVDLEMSAFRECLGLYQLGDFLDSDIICDAVLDAMDYNNKLRIASFYQWAIRAPSSNTACHPFEFEHDSFVKCAKMAYSQPKRSSRPSVYNLRLRYAVAVPFPRGITTPFLQLILAFRDIIWCQSPPATRASNPEFIRKLQDVPGLLGDMVLVTTMPRPECVPWAWVSSSGSTRVCSEFSDSSSDPDSDSDSNSNSDSDSDD